MNSIQWFDWGRGVSVIKYALYFSGIEEDINVPTYLNIRYKTKYCGGIGYLAEETNDPNGVFTSAILKKVDKNIFEIIYLFKPGHCMGRHFETESELLLNVEDIVVVF